MNKNIYDFNNRTAVITGGAQGFGLDIAKKFLQSGAKVIIWDIDKKLTEQVVETINNKNLSANIVDISNFQEVETAVTQIIKNGNLIYSFDHCWDDHRCSKKKEFIKNYLGIK